MTIADRRLHPATLLLRAGRTAPAIVLASFPALFDGRVTALLLALLGAILVLSVVGHALALHRFRYGVGSAEIVIESGLFSRARRVIPFERIQDIELVRPPLARLLGLARARIETGGGGADEGILDSLGIAEAQALRDAVRARLDHGAVTGGSEPPVLFAMSRRRVLAEGLLSPSLLFVAFAAAIVENLGPLFGRTLGWERFALGEHDLLTVDRLAVLALLCAPLAIVSGMARAVGQHHGFVLSRAASGLRIRRGLLTRSETAVPLARMQALIVRDRPLWRAFGWARLEVQTLGFGASRAGRLALAPFARAAEIDRIVAAAEWRWRWPVYRRASSASLLRHGIALATSVLLALATWGIARTAFDLSGRWFAPPSAIGVAIGVATLVLALVAVRWRVHGYVVADGVLYIRAGWPRRLRWAVPLANAQAFALLRDPLQRLLGLASLSVDTAGAAGRWRPRIVDLPVVEAEALLRQWRTLRRSA